MDNRINQHLCRLCGCKNENGQMLSSDNGAELLVKVQETYSMLVSNEINITEIKQIAQKKKLVGNYVYHV